MPILSLKRSLIPVFVLCVLGVLIYSNTFDSSFQFDDRPSIISNPAIKDISNLPAVWNFWPTRFLTYLSVAFNYNLGQLNVAGYHAFNIVIHIASAIMVWLLTMATLSAPGMSSSALAKHSDKVSFLAALIFISHPIQTQGVTYIVQRATSLTALFYLAALFFYVKSRVSGGGAQKGLYYALSLVSCAAAMFTKEMSVTIPFMILAYEIYFLKAKDKSINWKALAPFFVMLAIIPVTMLLTDSVNFRELKRTIELPVTISQRDYFLTQFRVIVTYIRLLFIPLNQNVDYDYPVTKNFFEPPSLASLVFLILVLAAAFKMFKKYRLLSFSIAAFFITLIPESSIIPISDVIFEHRLYLPMAWFGMFLAGSLYYILGSKYIKIAVFLSISVVVVYSALAYNRNFIWKTELTFWDDIVRKSPNKPRPHNERGNIYSKLGNQDLAIADYNEAIKVDPAYAGAYYNLGLISDGKGELDKAIDYYTKSLASYSAAETYCNRGVIYGRKGDFDRAMQDFDKAIELNPRFAGAYVNRGFAYSNKGNIDAAMADYTKAIECDQASGQAYNNRAMVYYAKKEYGMAWADMSKALSLGYKADANIVKALKEITASKKPSKKSAAPASNSEAILGME